jgi:hypothetical protein
MVCSASLMSIQWITTGTPDAAGAGSASSWWVGAEMYNVWLYPVQTRSSHAFPSENIEHLVGNQGVTAPVFYPAAFVFLAVLYMPLLHCCTHCPLI